MNRCYQLLDEISEFCRSHGRDVPEFSDSDFVDDFAFLVESPTFRATNSLFLTFITMLEDFMSKSKFGRTFLKRHLLMRIF